MTNKICFDNNYCIDSEQIIHYNNPINYSSTNNNFNNIFNNLESMVFDDISTRIPDISYNSTIKLRDISNNNYILNYNASL